jgi:hypothetical protein
MQKHIATSDHKLCNCGGYHYPHRPESACCEQNASGMYLQASRAGASDDELMEIAADLALNGKCKVLGKNNTVPF